MNLPKKEEIVQLTFESILKKISDYDIYRFYVGSDIQINRAICSPLRKDSVPSFIVKMGKDGYLHHLDYGDSRFQGRAVDFVSQMFFLNYNEALQKINKDFGLGYKGEGKQEYKKITTNYSKPVLDIKRYSLIQVSSKKFTNDGLAYWNDYYQDIEDLKKNNVYQVKEVWLNKKKVFIDKNELCFGYLFNDSAWKIYFPHRPKGEKFITNVALNVPYGLSNLDKNHNALITKSMKDMLVALKVYPYTCGIQSENIAAITDETMEYIKQNSKLQYLNFDSDEPGKKASFRVTEKYGIKHINVPDSLLLEGGSDLADWAKMEGLQALKMHFTRKKLYK
jgi:hypothetical protein